MDVEVRPLSDEERSAAGAVAGRALAHNPTSRWVIGDDPLVRLRASLDLFVGLVEREPAPPLGSLLGRHVVGVCSAAAPGECIGNTAPAELRVAPATIGPPGDPTRAQWVWAQFTGHDLAERHWHVGPVSVEPSLQGLGVGSRMLAVLGERMDADGEVAWLETDKPENVVFYRRHGFAVADEVAAHGFTTWFMRRDPR